MAVADVDTVANLHAVHFPRNVAVRFGARFVRAYMRLFIDSPAAIALVATQEGDIIGYLLGITNASEHRPTVRRRRLTLIATALPALPRNTVFLMRVATRKLRNRLRSAVGPSGEALAPVAVLSHVAVNADRRSGGVGAALVFSFEKAAVGMGTRTAVLATVAGEDGADGFYDALGWKYVSSGETVDGRTLRVYQKRLSSAGSDA